MKVLIVQNHHAEDLGVYESYIQAHAGDYSVFNAYENRTFPELAEFDSLIVGGTPISIYDPGKPEWLKAEITWLTEAVKKNKPYLGVCGGGQILACILGAKVKPNPLKEVGSYMLNLTTAGQASPFFKGFPDKFPVFQFHGDTFDVPGGAKLLAEGVDCKNQAFSQGKTLALQFHLEVSSETAGKWADEYKEWLGGFSKSKAQIMEECVKIEPQMKILSDLLMENFLRVTKLR